MMPAGVNSYLKNIVKAYNKEEAYVSEQEKRTPEYMPHISAHTLRHTGCTRLAEKQIAPKVMQQVMGHADVGITFNVYSHVDKQYVQTEMEKMNDSSVV